MNNEIAHYQPGLSIMSSFDVTMPFLMWFPGAFLLFSIGLILGVAFCVLTWREK